MAVVSNGVLGRRLGWDRSFDQYEETWTLAPESSDDPIEYRKWLEASVVNRLALPLLERALAPFEPRPHWGKLTSFDAATIRSRYSNIEHFDELRRSLDPSRAFDTPALRSVLG